jgi:outer membrane protein insertion porin family
VSYIFGNNLKLQKLVATATLLALSLGIGGPGQLLLPALAVDAEDVLPKLDDKQPNDQLKTAPSEPTSSADSSAAVSADKSAKDAQPLVGKIGDDHASTDADKSAALQSPASPEKKPASPNTATTSQAPGSDLTVDEVKVEGNRLVPTEDIMNVVKTKPGDRFSRDQVAADLRAINGLGYFDDRTLKAVPERSGSGVLLKITVTENQPVSQFSFEGNKVLSSEDIHRIFADQLEKPQNLNRLSAAIDKVEQAYHQRGFVLARVSDVKDDPDGSISLSINEGIIDDIKIAGNQKTKDFIIKNAIKLKPGQVYNERQLTGDLRNLYANGYFQDIRRSLAPSPTNPDKYTLKVEVDEKRTGSISLGGGVDTMAGPFGNFGVGDNNFRGRGENVSLNAQVGSGLFGGINNTLNNAGQSFMSTQRTYNVEANYGKQIPGTNINMNLSAFDRMLNSQFIDFSQQRTIGAGVTFSKPLSKKVQVSLGITGQNTYLNDLSSFYSNGANLTEVMGTRAIQTGMASTIPQALAVANTARSNMLHGGTYMTVNPGISYDSRDARIDPTHGTYARASISPAMGINGAFGKAGVTMTKVVTIAKDTTWNSNLQMGTSMGNLPGFSQYNLGGFNGLPGYRMFSDFGSGTSMLMAKTEVRRRLIPKTDNKIMEAFASHVKGAVFADAGEIGNINTYSTLMSRSSTGAAVGVGLRLKVPMVGMVRVDYGYPLISTLMGGHTPRLTFGFGDY